MITTGLWPMFRRNIWKCKRFLILLPLLLATQNAIAEGYYVAVGYDFIPDSADISLGFQAKYVAIEANILNMGKEEPTTKPGRENSLNVLAFILPWPVFIKAGIVDGESNKHGYTLGGGADYVLNGNWAIRGQVTQYRVSEDFDSENESENILSVALKYQF